MGTQKLYSFVHNNPANISKNDNVVAINSALGVDLYGQIAGETDLMEVLSVCIR